MIQIGAIGPIELIYVNLLKPGKMIIVKEMNQEDHHIEYRLRMKDESTINWGGDGWATLAIYVDCPHRMIPLLHGLKDFPEELREKIYSMHILQELEEQVVLRMVGIDLHRTWNGEHFRLFREQMDDFYNLCDVLEDTVGINMLNASENIFEFFDETNAMLGNEI